LRNEYTVGINWFIKGQALKVMLNYVFCDSQNQEDSHKIILATQVVL
ncbi:MAG: OprO/OprP family phosphate-selective porin, partial [Candidatus Gastranaerophilales bacterium]|nr:OprO/OprP family phosphate-selective porin [Candidatus Gastranaerophilales bacterium]